MANTVNLSFKNLDSSVVSLSQDIEGTYDVIHQWIDYHTPNAVDYTCNVFTWKINGSSLSFTFSDYTELTSATKTAMAAELDVDMALTGDAAIVGGKLRITPPVTATSFSVEFQSMSSRILFDAPYVSTDVTIGSYIDIEFRDRTNIKYYSITFDEADSNVSCSNNTTPTLLVSAYDSQLTGQQIFFGQPVSSLTINMREYNALTDLNPEDIPDLHILLKKTSSSFSRRTFVYSQDYNPTTKQVTLPLDVLNTYELEYTWAIPEDLPIIWSSCNVIVTDLGTITLPELYSYDSAAIETAIETGTSRTYTESVDGTEYTYTQTTSPYPEWQWDNALTTADSILGKSGTETSATLVIDTAKLPEQEPQMMNVTITEADTNTSGISDENLPTFVMPMFDSIADGQEFYFPTSTKTLTIKFYRAHFPEVEVFLENEWAFMFREL